MGRWKSWPGDVCLYVQALLPLEPERLVGSRRADIHSMRRNGGKTMVLLLDQSFARGTCYVRSRKALQKVVAKGGRQTNGRIWLILRGLIATISGLNPLW